MNSKIAWQRTHAISSMNSQITQLNTHSKPSMNSKIAQKSTHSRHQSKIAQKSRNSRPLMDRKSAASISFVLFLQLYSTCDVSSLHFSFNVGICIILISCVRREFKLCVMVASFKLYIDDRELFSGSQNIEIFSNLNVNFLIYFGLNQTMLQKTFYMEHLGVIGVFFNLK